MLKKIVNPKNAKKKNYSKAKLIKYMVDITLHPIQFLHQNQVQSQSITLGYALCVQYGAIVKFLAKSKHPHFMHGCARVPQQQFEYKYRGSESNPHQSVSYMIVCCVQTVYSVIHRTHSHSLLLLHTFILRTKRATPLVASRSRTYRYMASR